MLSTVIVGLLVLFRSCGACSPFGRESLLVAQSMLGPDRTISTNELFSSASSSSNVRARGQNTHLLVPSIPSNPKSMSVSLGVPSAPPIRKSSDLNCAHFDESCRWRNVDGLFVDELDWYQGSGELDASRMAVATATHVLPDGSYAIAATELVQFPTTKAVLVSDEIACQSGDGEIRFISPIDKTDPGPVFINIPDQGPVPFQIYLIADHFTFNSDNLKGGFAIIDSIEYYAKMCQNGGQEAQGNSFDPSDELTQNGVVPLIPLAESSDETARVTSKRAAVTPPTLKLGISRHSDTKTGIYQFESILDKKPNIVANLENDEDDDGMSSICEVAVCSFNESELCSRIASKSGWQLSNEPVGNPLTGIRGDASSLPYHEEGSFAYIEGPQFVSRLQTSSFFVDQPVTLVFSYYKADKISELRVLLKPEYSKEFAVFRAPRLTKTSRRWYRESIQIAAGSYEYMAFEASNLKSNNYIGIDEMFVVDDKRKSFCLKFH
ncbi:unnamed protein product [Caenorhabditis bovis]|uniref:MAM domain-containing protein n=1 Tax=Caenorhabditis bovis TaxID=2654633 RepID=A0A8S1ELC3_9PELO|nr:unnamed protein product [Caenorhabditis bovis]